MASDWGFKLSQTGYDVSTTAPQNMVFTSGARTVRVFATGTVALNIPTSANETTILVSMTYFNNANEVGNTLFDYMPAITASTVINGNRYITNTPSLYVGATSPDDFHYFYCTNSRTYGVMSKHFITLGRTASSTKWNTNEDFTIRWFIVGAQ